MKIDNVALILKCVDKGIITAKEANERFRKMKEVEDEIIREYKEKMENTDVARKSATQEIEDQRGSEVQALGREEYEVQQLESQDKDGVQRVEIQEKSEAQELDKVEQEVQQLETKEGEVQGLEDQEKTEDLPGTSVKSLFSSSAGVTPNPFSVSMPTPVVDYWSNLIYPTISVSSTVAALTKRVEEMDHQFSEAIRRVSDDINRRIIDEVGNLFNNEMDRRFATLNGTYYDARLMALEAKMLKIERAQEDIMNTQKKFLDIVAKQSDVEGINFMGAYYFLPSRLKESYIVDVKFINGSEQTLDLLSIARQSQSFTKKLGTDVGCELFRHMLRKIYGNDLRHYSVNEKSRRGHHFIGSAVLEKMMELIFDGYNLQFRERDLFSEKLYDMLIKSGGHVCANDRRRPKPGDKRKADES